jgi:hypothetical protein
MTALGKIALWCFRDVRKRGVLVRDFVRYKDLFEEVLAARSGSAAVKAVLRYILGASGRLPKDEVERIVQLATTKGIEGTMGSLAEQLEEIGMEKGMEKGLKRGRLESRREMLARLLRKRFGELPESAAARVNAADIPMLDAWADRVITAQSLDEVWAES